MEWAGQVRLARKLAIALTVAAMASGVATYVALTGSAPFDPDPTTILVLLTVDLVLLLLLGAVVARRIVQVWAERRRGAAGSRLHIRLVVMFSLVAVTPAIFVAVFSALFFNLGIESWFNERVRTALEESVAVAESYLDEHQQVIRADVLAMANDLNRSGPALLQNPKRFSKFVATQTVVRSLEEAIVFDGSGRLLARSMVSFVLEFDPIPNWALDKARNGEVALIVNDDDDRVRALVRLDRFVDTFLYVGRFVDSKVLGHMERTQGAVREYEQLEQRRSGL
ncbi:MAG: two-component sensor histidine kinase, partial [Alphaproteobacteria bacterium]